MECGGGGGGGGGGGNRNFVLSLPCTESKGIFQVIRRITASETSNHLSNSPTVSWTHKHRIPNYEEIKDKDVGEGVWVDTIMARSG